MVLRNYILTTPRMPMELAYGESEGSGLFRKEVAYCGAFTKRRDDGEVEFELPVNESLLDHWCKTFEEMRKAGVDVPVPLGHVTDPEARRGTVEKLSKEYNPRRKANALFAYVRFNDPKTAAALKNSNCSLFMPPDFTDGKGNRYERPIRHLALTDYPVIPDLDPFEAAVAASHDRRVIAASYVLSQEENEDMARPANMAEGLTWEAVAQELGIEVPEGQDAEAAVKEAYDAEPAGGGGGAPAPEEEVVPEGEDDELSLLGFEDDTMPEEEEEDDLEMPENRSHGGNRRSTPPEMSFAFDQPTVLPTIVNQVAEARKTKITQLVRDRKLSPAAGKQAIKDFCTSDVVGFALSHEAAGGPQDGFDRFTAACSLNTPLAAIGEKSGPQDSPQQGKSPIEIDAENRAAKAIAQRQRR